MMVFEWPAVLFVECVVSSLNLVWCNVVFHADDNSPSGIAEFVEGHVQSVSHEQVMERSWLTD